MTRAATYRLLAAQNLSQAERAATPQLRQWFLEIANTYAQMAAQIERTGSSATVSLKSQPKPQRLPPK
jgi:hypothetical protein